MHIRDAETYTSDTVSVPLTCERKLPLFIVAFESMVADLEEVIDESRLDQATKR